MIALLTKLGFSTKEIDVYTTLLSLGLTTPGSVAEKLSIPRPTVYKILEDLHKKGYVKTDLTTKKKVFYTTPAEELHIVLGPIKHKLREQEQLIADLQPVIERQQTTPSGYTPKIQYISQDHIEDFLKDQTPKWNKSMQDKGVDYIGYQDSAYTPVIEEWIRWYWQQPSTNSISLRLLSNTSTFEKEILTPITPQRRVIRPWDNLGNITYSTWINGDYTIMINIRIRPFYLIEIFDPNFAESQRQIFEVMWNSSSPEL